MFLKSIDMLWELSTWGGSEVEKNVDLENKKKYNVDNEKEVINYARGLRIFKKVRYLLFGNG